jgi:uncharacterized Zn ribbon protein
MENQHCAQCGEEYRVARHWQRFCCPQCRDAWHYDQWKIAEVKEAEAVRDAKKQLRKQIDGMQIVEALKYRREVAPVARENGLRRRHLG